MDKKRIIICILGPTASGKTKLAVELARKLKGEIISADSRQVFRGLDMGTGKDLSEYGEVKYHLIDICEPGEGFTLFDWLKLAREKIDEIIEQGNVPIIVGGTNLYIRALIEGFEIKSPLSLRAQRSNLKINEIATSRGSVIRNDINREELDRLTVEKLQNILKKLSPEMLEKIDCQNPRRLVRAIENAQSGSVPIKKKPDFEALLIGIEMPREELYAKIDQRVDLRFKQGMLEEVEGLIDAGVSTDWLKKLGLEYRIITTFITQKSKIKNQNDNAKLKNHDSFYRMAQELKYKTHAFARRQLTWLKKMTNIKFTKNLSEAEKLVKKFLKN